jgi:hypothetical protein
MKNQIISGSCHCGTIAYQLETDFKLEDLPVRICTCDFCTKSGNRYISDAKAHLVIFWDEPKVNRYQFGTKTADFIICKQCGTMPFVLSKIDGHYYAVVNINTITEQNQSDQKDFSRLNYDEELIKDRLNRRRKNWIGKVTISTLDKKE